jgi:hypothetical protein
MTKEELKQKAKDWCKSKNLTPSNVGYFTSDYCEQSYIAGATEATKELEAQIKKMKKYGKLLQDICDVMGNDPYMVWRGLEQRVLILWDKSEEEKGLKMADDILERLLKISAIDWAEIEKWEIKEK